jgi:hypothetical protein
MNWKFTFSAIVMISVILFTLFLQKENIRLKKEIEILAEKNAVVEEAQQQLNLSWNQLDYIGDNGEQCLGIFIDFKTNFTNNGNLMYLYYNVVMQSATSYGTIMKTGIIGGYALDSNYDASKHFFSINMLIAQHIKSHFTNLVSNDELRKLYGYDEIQKMRTKNE